MMSHRKERPYWAWLLATVAWVLSVIALVLVLSGCRAEQSPDTARKDTHPCRCGDRDTLKRSGR